MWQNFEHINLSTQDFTQVVLSHTINTRSLESRFTGVIQRPNHVLIVLLCFSHSLADYFNKLYQ